jgi:hypothetical protein
MEDIFLEINRYGFIEETHFTIAYSPGPDESVADGIGGVLATVHEITEKVRNERRLALLQKLGARSTYAKIRSRCLRKRGADFTQRQRCSFLTLLPD